MSESHRKQKLEKNPPGIKGSQSVPAVSFGVKLLVGYNLNKESI